jgi:membrane protein YqaA with SNARE-associated domain
VTCTHLISPCNARQKYFTLLALRLVHRAQNHKPSLGICLAHTLPSVRDSRDDCDVPYSAVFVVPLGSDALVIVLASTHGESFWIVPLLVTAFSLAGAALTYWVGRSAGEIGLPRLVSARHLDRMKSTVQRAGAGRLAAAAVLPPPFPLTPFVLTCGALDVDRRRFFLVFGMMRLIRFTAVALLIRQYGDRVRQFLESQQLQTGVIVLVFVASAALIASAVVLFRRTRPLAA